MTPLSEFIRVCDAYPHLPLSFYVGAPLTAMERTFWPLDLFRDDLADRVVYISAMAATWHGRLNLLGTNFNVGVAPNAAFKVLMNGNVFPNARIITVPTETCKSGYFTLEGSEIEKLPLSPQLKHSPARDVISRCVSQWTTVRVPAAAQPLFDVVCDMPIQDLVTYCQLVGARLTGDRRKATVVRTSTLERSPTTEAEGTSDFEDSDDVLGLNSHFPHGLYATGPRVSNDMGDRFKEFLGTLFAQH